MVNILSFDVEEWFDSHFLAAGNTNLFKRRVDEGVRKIIEILQKNKIKCTFFILGRVAEDNPKLVKIIDDEGHEIASHGFSHKPIFQLTPEEFRKDLLLSIQILKSITSKEVLGFRSPGYSITKDSLWALDVLRDCGLKYDSSIYPVSLRLFTHGGISGNSQRQFYINDGLVEFPLATMNIFGLRLPVATTCYFRLFPYSITKGAIKKLNNRGLSATLNFHTWEFDEHQPRVKMPLAQSIKHYYNLSKTNERFEKLVNEFSFVSCKEGLERFLNSRNKMLKID